MEMEKAIIGKKLGMTQIFDEVGRVVPVTVIQAGPCIVMQKKTAEKDGYEAIQLGYDAVAERKLTKPELGHQKKAGVTEFKKVLKEFPLKDCSKFEVGDQLGADVFAVGDYVDVTGVSKGHGFQGVIKRHGAHRLKETHGTGPVHRHAGSMGSGTDPSRIFKGKIGAGQMGNEQVTVQNLDVVEVDTELGVIAVRGAIPGPKGGIVFLKNTVKTNPEPKGTAGVSTNPQKASARVNPQKASARNH
jgi:large subunit ribosomal protein L3